MKNLWTVWISRKINQHFSTSEKMSWANAHLNLCKLLETELRLAQRLSQLLLLRSAKFKLFKDFSFYHRSTSFERSSSSFNLAVHVNKVYILFIHYYAAVGSIWFSSSWKCSRAEISGISSSSEIREILMKVFQLGSIDSNFQILSVLYKVDWTVLNYVACTRPLMKSREPKVKF